MSNLWLKKQDGTLVPVGGTVLGSQIHAERIFFNGDTVCQPAGTTIGSVARDLKIGVPYLVIAGFRACQGNSISGQTSLQWDVKIDGNSLIDGWATRYQLDGYSGSYEQSRIYTPVASGNHTFSFWAAPTGDVAQVYGSYIILIEMGQGAGGDPYDLFVPVTERGKYNSRQSVSLGTTLTNPAPSGATKTAITGINPLTIAAAPVNRVALITLRYYTAAASYFLNLGADWATPWAYSFGGGGQLVTYALDVPKNTAVPMYGWVSQGTTTIQTYNDPLTNRCDILLMEVP